MQKQIIKFDTLKFASVSKNFVSNINGLNTGMTKLTAMDGSVTPEQVSQVLTEEILPAIQGAVESITQINEALPTSEGEGESSLDNLGNDGEIGNDHGEGMSNQEKEIGVLSAMGDPDKDDKVHTATDAEDAALQKRLQHMDAKYASIEKQVASVVGENITMKKAKLAKLYASTFPPYIRTAIETEFLKENEDEEIEAMEAKLASASKVLESYKTAGLLKKASMPNIVTLHTAKMTTKSGDKEVIPWQMR